MFKPMNTSDESVTRRKVLLYGHHGWGKTTQMANYQRHYGKGFIISGEAGLSSIRSANVDFLPFSSFDGVTDPEKGIYSFKAICKMIASDDFKDAGYKWIGLDSLTELGDMVLEHVQHIYKDDKNGFKLWGDYKNIMLGACKWVRDLPYHVIVTALAKEESDDNGVQNYWPFVAGSAVQKQLPGIFDCVMCGIRTTGDDGQGNQRVHRYVVTDEVKGWHGKVRDEKHRLKPVERSGDIAELLSRLDMTDEEFSKLTTREGA